MSDAVTIGEFARLSHLTAKALRHYHEIGVLVPRDVDRFSGYRRYTTDQLPQALLVRRLRDLDMPLEEVRRVISAPDDRERDRVIGEHLERMERALDRAQSQVASLRLLLAPPDVPDISYRILPTTWSAARHGHVDRADIAGWCAETFPRLYQAAERAGVAVTGPGGGLYGEEFFADGHGRVTAYIPVASKVGAGFDHELPAQRMAVIEHHGAFIDLDRTYAALGSHVIGADLAGAGPIREHYLFTPADTPDPADWITEVCWPIRAQ